MINDFLLNVGRETCSARGLSLGLVSSQTRLALAHATSPQTARIEESSRVSVHQVHTEGLQRWRSPLLLSPLSSSSTALDVNFCPCIQLEFHSPFPKRGGWLFPSHRTSLSEIKSSNFKLLNDKKGLLALVKY